VSDSENIVDNSIRLKEINLRGSLREAMKAPLTVFEMVGGQQFFDQLVDRFYDAVEGDQQLRPMYPKDLRASRRRLASFLAQYWGGPPHYSEMRGHPRLRMRHLPFTIGQAERDAWMAHMTASLDSASVADGTGRPLPAQLRTLMFEHFDNAATFLINKN
jgi:hemoglobin